MLYIILSFIIILLIVFIVLIKYKIKQEQLFKEEYLQNKKQEYDQLFILEQESVNALQAKHDQLQARIEEQESSANKIINQLTQRKEEVKRSVAETVANQNQLISEKIKNHYDQEYRDYKTDLLTTQAELLNNASYEFYAQLNEYKSRLNQIKTEIDDYQAKRNVINEDILRQRAIEEDKDFYRVNLTKENLEDINRLISIADNFHNIEVIYKLIWTEYIQPKFKTTLNRVLKNRDPRNVIYMIKNLETNEIYIGKTKAEVSKRWTEHIKTSLNIGSISKTKIHTALFNNWNNFSFTVLEEVPLEKSLGDREKYWINFYQSDIYGYNIKSGG